MTATIDQFKALLAAFKKLPPTLQRDPTTLEISGYPHLEDVYSNILAFFLDPGCEHGFGPIFLESLLSVAEYDKEEMAIKDGEAVEVNREEITGTRKRIDLVISTDTLIVGIENKIYHHLHNDLEDYGQHLTKQAKANGHRRRICKILLGLNLPNDDNELFGFKPITYQEYFGEILRRIGPTLIGSKDRYLKFVMEMIETVKHLKEGSAVNPEKLDFIKNNREDVEALWKEAETLKKEMRGLVKKLRGALDISNLQGQSRPITGFLYRESHTFFDTLVHNIEIKDGFIIAIDTYISPEGWGIDVFPREGDFQRLRPWLETTQERNYWKEVEEQQRRYRLDLSADLSYHASPHDVAARVKSLLESAMTYPFP